MSHTLTGAMVAAETEGDAVQIATLGFVLGILGLSLLLLALPVRQGVAIYRVRAGGARDTELRELVAASNAAQERSAAATERAEARLDDLSKRFASLERVLKEVE
jgi:hypothetical protein